MSFSWDSSHATTTCILLVNVDVKNVLFVAHLFFLLADCPFLLVCLSIVENDQVSLSLLSLRFHLLHSLLSRRVRPFDSLFRGDRSAHSEPFFCVTVTRALDAMVSVMSTAHSPVVKSLILFPVLTNIGGVLSIPLDLIDASIDLLLISLFERIADNCASSDRSQCICHMSLL